jgi:hypothetical protein
MDQVCRSAGQTLIDVKRRANARVAIAGNFVFDPVF